MNQKIKNLNDRANKLLESKVEDSSQLRDELRTKLQQLRDGGFLPKGYAKTINEQLGIKDRNLIYHVITGKGGKFDYLIAKAIIDLASKPKPEKELIEKANRLLES